MRGPLISTNSPGHCRIPTRSVVEWLLTNSVYKHSKVASKPAIPLPFAENVNKMDVDNWQAVSDADTDSGTQPTQIVESNPGSPQKSPKDRLVDLLDQVEMHVERLRRDALKLEEEKDTLLTTLDTLRNSEMLIELSDSKYRNN